MFVAHHQPVCQQPVFYTGKCTACYHMAVSRSLLIPLNLLFSSLVILPTPFPVALTMPAYDLFCRSMILHALDTLHLALDLQGD